MTELEKFLTSLYDAILEAEVSAHAHGQTALHQLTASRRFPGTSRIPVYHATNVSVDLDVGLEAREVDGATRVFVTDGRNDDTTISFDLEVYDFVEPDDLPPLEIPDLNGDDDGDDDEGPIFRPLPQPELDFLQESPWRTDPETLQRKVTKQQEPDRREAEEDTNEDEADENGDGGDGRSEEERDGKADSEDDEPDGDDSEDRNEDDEPDDDSSVRRDPRIDPNVSELRRRLKRGDFFGNRGDDDE